jgi:hypothetical protein
VLAHADLNDTMLYTPVSSPQMADAFGRLPADWTQPSRNRIGAPAYRSHLCVSSDPGLTPVASAQKEKTVPEAACKPGSVRQPVS